MRFNATAARDLATEPSLKGADLRVWLHLVDSSLCAAEVAKILNTTQSNVAASCRRLYYSGWIDLVDEVGRVKRYTARSERNPKVALKGQLTLEGKKC